MAGEEYINVTADGGVRKKVVSEGTGEAPPLHAQCLVHYKGSLVESQEVFMDTRKEGQAGEPAHIVAGRDASLREVGLNLAVATMRKGERCHLKVQPQYGYGDRGSFSFPNVPPRAELEYDLELIDFDPADELKDRGQMTYEERLEAAERHRLTGNSLFQQGEHTDALGKYAMALSYINDDFIVQLHGPHAAKAAAVKQPVHLNMAACQLKLKDWQGAEWNCSQVLQEDKDNVKALFRRGKAHSGMGHTDEALRDLQAAAKLAPTDKAIGREIQAVRATMKRDREAQARLFKGAFGSPGDGRSKGLWEDTAEQQQQHRQSFLAWLWGIVVACLSIFTLSRNRKVK